MSYRYSKTLKPLAWLLQHAAALEQCIHQLSRELVDAKQPSRHVDADTNGYANSLSATSVLPDEMLSTISSQGVELDTHPCGTPHRMAFECVVAQVSRRWRDISVNTPSLWSSIKVRPYSDCAPSRSMELLDVYLRRSKPCLLQISFQMELHDVDYHILSQSLSRLVPHIDRWEEVTVVAIDEQFFRQIFLPLRDLSAPCLRHIHIDNSSNFYDEGAIIHSPPISLAMAPKLLSLEIRYLPLRFFDIPFPTFTVFHFAGYIPPQSRLQFRKMIPASLTELLLPWNIASSLAQDCLPLIELPSLVRLILSKPCEGEPDRSIGYSLSFLSTPSLQFMEIFSLILVADIDDVSEIWRAVRAQPGHLKYASLRSLKLHFSEIDVQLTSS